MRICHVVPSFDPSLGGPPQAALSLAAAQAAMGVSVSVLTQSGRFDEHGWKTSIPGVDRVQLIRLNGSGGPWSPFFPRRRSQVRDIVSQADAVHLHGLWEPLVYVAATAAIRTGTPYAVATHGYLTPWSLSQKPRKKALALALGFKRVLRNARAIQVFTQQEADSIRPKEFRAKCWILPNGLFEGKMARLPPEGGFRSRYPGLGGSPLIVFIGRLHPGKGLDLLVSAFASVHEQVPEARLAVIGPDDGARNDLENAIAQKGMEDAVVVTGPMYGQEKWEALVDATCLCLPSRHEAFSMVILEALAARLPVIISDRCNFPEVSRAGAGAVVPLESEALAEALTMVVSNPELRAEMAAKARELSSQYSWESIARRSLALYED